jgi:isopentenyldiphosphate isomerase
MLELVYLDGPAEIIPSPTAENPYQAVKGEYFPVVEPCGLVVGKALRSYCYSGAKVLHPVVHLHIIDREGRILLQKRSMTKDIQPGKWDTAVGGHVDYGESIKEALYREVSEELGLVNFNPIPLMTYEFESSIERELVNVFAAVGSLELKPDPEDIDDARFWTLEEVEASLEKSILTPNFESEFLQIKDKLKALL